MAANLRLTSFPLPRLPKTRVRTCLTDPNKQWLGLMTEEGLYVLSYRSGLAEPVLFALPAAANRMRQEEMRLSLFGQIASLQVQRPAEEAPLALHPHGDLAAQVTDERISLIRPGATVQSVYTFPEAEAAQVKAALFSSSGDVLWVSREYPYSAARQSLTDPWHEALAFSTTDYRLLGRLAVQGEQQGEHTLAAHPAPDVVGVEVSCGQDGSWITFASVRAGSVERRAEQVNSDNDPLHFAGFAPDGRSLITISATVVEEFGWPGGLSTARVNSEADDEAGELYFGWNGAYVGSYFFTLAEGEGEDVLRAFACPGLRPLPTVQVEAEADELSGTLYGLGADLLITHRAGAVQAWRVNGQ